MSQRSSASSGFGGGRWPGEPGGDEWPDDLWPDDDEPARRRGGGAGGGGGGGSGGVTRGRTTCGPMMTSRLAGAAGRRVAAERESRGQRRSTRRVCQATECRGGGSGLARWP